MAHPKHAAENGRNSATTSAVGVSVGDIDWR
jgi:hypothetical protein